MPRFPAAGGIFAKVALKAATKIAVSVGIQIFVSTVMDLPYVTVRGPSSTAKL